MIEAKAVFMGLNLSVAMTGLFSFLWSYSMALLKYLTYQYFTSGGYFLRKRFSISGYAELYSAVKFGG